MLFTYSLFQTNILVKGEEPSLTDDIMAEIKSKNGEVDGSNQSFSESRKFAEQIAPIIQTPRQLVSLDVCSHSLTVVVLFILIKTNQLSFFIPSFFTHIKRYVP